MYKEKCVQLALITMISDEITSAALSMLNGRMMATVGQYVDSDMSGFGKIIRSHYTRVISCTKIIKFKLHDSMIQQFIHLETKCLTLQLTT